MKEVIIQLDSDIKNRKEIKRLKKKANRLINKNKKLKSELEESNRWGEYFFDLVQNQKPTIITRTVEFDNDPSYSEGMYDGCGI